MRLVPTRRSGNDHFPSTMARGRPARAPRATTANIFIVVHIGLVVISAYVAYRAACHSQPPGAVSLNNHRAHIGAETLVWLKRHKRFDEWLEAPTPDYAFELFVPTREDMPSAGVTWAFSTGEPLKKMDGYGWDVSARMSDVVIFWTKADTSQGPASYPHLAKAIGCAGVRVRRKPLVDEGDRLWTPNFGLRDVGNQTRWINVVTFDFSE